MKGGERERTVLKCYAASDFRDSKARKKKIAICASKDLTNRR